eukprot:s1077_g17.t1
MAGALDTSIPMGKMLQSWADSYSRPSGEDGDVDGHPVRHLVEIECAKIVPSWPEPGADSFPLQNFLRSETRELLGDLFRLLLPRKKMPVNAPRSAVKASEREWYDLVKAAWERGLMTVVDDSAVPRDRSNHLITCGAGAITRVKKVKIRALPVGKNAVATDQSWFEELSVLKLVDIELLEKKPEETSLSRPFKDMCFRTGLSLSKAEQMLHSVVDGMQCADYDKRKGLLQLNQDSLVSYIQSSLALLGSVSCSRPQLCSWVGKTFGVALLRRTLLSSLGRTLELVMVADDDDEMPFPAAADEIMIRVRQGNSMVKRALLAGVKEAFLRERYACFEHPWDSLIWQPPEAIQLRAMPGMFFTYFNFCCFGGQGGNRPTGSFSLQGTQWRRNTHGLGAALWPWCCAYARAVKSQLRKLKPSPCAGIFDQEGAIFSALRASFRGFQSPTQAGIICKGIIRMLETMQQPNPICSISFTRRAAAAAAAAELTRKLAADLKGAYGLCQELHGQLKKQTDEFQSFMVGIRATIGHWTAHQHQLKEEMDDLADQCAPGHAEVVKLAEELQLARQKLQASQRRKSRRESTKQHQATIQALQLRIRELGHEARRHARGEVLQKLKKELQRKEEELLEAQDQNRELAEALEAHEKQAEDQAAKMEAALAQATQQGAESAKLEVKSSRAAAKAAKVEGAKELPKGSVVGFLKMMAEGAPLWKFCAGNGKWQQRFLALTPEPPAAAKSITWSTDAKYMGRRIFRRPTSVDIKEVVQISFGAEALPAGQRDKETEPWCCFSVWTPKRSFHFKAENELIAENFVLGLSRLCPGSKPILRSQLLLQRALGKLGPDAKSRAAVLSKALRQAAASRSQL